MSAVMQETTDASIYKVLSIKDVQPDPNQPRQIFSDESLSELSDSIKSMGVIQPIVIRKDGKQAIIVDGERRYRASKLAKVKTIPTIEHVDSDEDPATTFIKQVAANQHEDLRPMEIAGFLDTLVTRYGKKIGEVHTLLEEHGIKKYSGPAVRNLRRLVNLPDWAKEMINTDQLTASHGKIILQVIDQPELIKYVKDEIDDHFFRGNEIAPTVERLANIVEHAYGAHCPDLNVLGFDQPIFEIETCSGCKTRRTFKPTYGPEKIYCLDQACFDKKQGEAIDQRDEKEAQEQQEKAAKTLAAVEAGEEAPEPEPEPTSDASIAQQKGRVERTQCYLDEWLRGQLVDHLARDNNTLYSILLWCGAGAPGNTHHGYNVSGGLDKPDIDRDKSMKHGINLALKHKIDHAELLLDIVKNALASMDRANLRRLAHHCDIKLEGNFTIDAGYLQIKTKDEIIETTPPQVQMNWTNWKEAKKEKSGELITAIVAFANDYGVPDDLVKYYSEVPA